MDKRKRFCYLRYKYDIGLYLCSAQLIHAQHRNACKMCVCAYGCHCFSVSLNIIESRAEMNDVIQSEIVSVVIVNRNNYYFIRISRFIIFGIAHKHTNSDTQMALENRMSSTQRNVINTYKHTHACTHSLYL